MQSDRMGVNLSGLTEPQNIELSDISGKKIAIDSYNIIYQFLSSIRQPDGQPLCDSSGRTTSHLTGLIHRTANLVEAGIEPVFVFDGKPHPLKAETLRERTERRDKAELEYREALEEGDMEKARTKAQQTSRMTKDIRESSRELISLLGFPMVDAPSDGEQQAAYMCQKGDVYAAASQDYDSLLFGTPVLLRNLTMTGRRKVPGRQMYKEVKTEVIFTLAFLATLGLTREQLVDMCILMGTDFNEGIKGIGPKKALKYVRENGKLENILPKISAEIPEYEEIRSIFLDYKGSDDYSLSAGHIERQKVLDMLTSYDFAENRIENVLDRIEKGRDALAKKRSQKTLDAWFRC